MTLCKNLSQKRIGGRSLEGIFSGDYGLALAEM